MHLLPLQSCDSIATSKPVEIISNSFLGAQLFNKTFAVRCGSGIRLPSTKAQLFKSDSVCMDNKKSNQVQPVHASINLVGIKYCKKLNETKQNITLKSVICKAIAGDNFRKQGRENLFGKVISKLLDILNPSKHKLPYKIINPLIIIIENCFISKYADLQSAFKYSAEQAQLWDST